LGRILHIDTATTNGSVCLAENGMLTWLRMHADQQSQAAVIPLFIQEALQVNGLRGSDLDAIAVSMGPGSYTGLRVGLATAKGLCYAWNKPLLGISTLQMMASSVLDQVTTDACIIPMIDARRMEVFTSVYNTQLECRMEPGPLLLDADSYAAFEGRPRYFLGDGSSKWETFKKPAATDFFLPYEMSASHMVPLAYKAFQLNQFENIAYATPTYLKSFYMPSKGG
jgi:tRNA threonylcarbamoyladenosine biosynthesis protein TsaB